MADHTTNKASTKSPALQAEYDRIGREREASGREADRIYRRELIRVCLEMFSWAAIGVLLLGMSFHVDNVRTGMIYFYLGQVVGLVGVVMSIWGAYERGQERGDW